MKWQITNPVVPQSDQELTQVLLTNRGVTDVESFFHPPHPLDISVVGVGIDQSHLEKSITRIKRAVENQEKILVFGDYDADGIAATTVLCRILHHVGAQGLETFIPDRVHHGYGLSPKAVAEVMAHNQPQLVITVDNGIVAHQSVAQLMAAGIDVIVTDHHAPETDPVSGQVSLPSALAIVHTTQLCGTTVAWMLARELERSLTGDVAQATKALDLCGLATIADQVRLQGANRSFAQVGIKALQTTARPGIQALCEVGGVSQADITADTVNYGLVPRINAMGRLEHGQKAFELLWTGSLVVARRLAQLINETNSRRQLLTRELLDQVRAQADAWATEHIIIVQSPAFHEGVIGLIAGRLVEEYAKPAIVLSVSQTQAKASARSVTGVNIVELIRQVRHDLIDVGGHPMAAGFSVLPEKLAAVTQQLQTFARQAISTDLLVRQIIVDCVIAPSLIDPAQVYDTLAVLDKFAPFGQGNPKPVFGLRQVTLLDAMAIGDHQQHLKMVVAPAGSYQPLACVGWGMGELLPELQLNQKLDVAGCLELNKWKNRQTVQLVLKDVRVSQEIENE